MSLINEALRKARKDAAERDAASGGVTYRPPRAHLPKERRWLGAMLGGIAVGALVAGLVFFALRPAPTPQAPRPLAPIEAEPVHEEPVEPAEPLAVQKVEPRSSGESASEASASRPAPTATALRESPTLAAETAARSDTSGTADISETAEVTRAAVQRDGEAKHIRPVEEVGKMSDGVYVLEAKKDGVTLRLDFIVWAPPNPFAQINGRQVNVGQTVDGFVVRSISREEVTLEGGGDSFRIRVR